MPEAPDNAPASGAVSRGDLDALMMQHGADFDWEPADEIAILRHLYGPERLTVSDGVDQYVRESVADWSQGVSRSSLRARRLTRCMRMKANLAAFVSDMASNLGIDDWDLEPNTDAPGGRVIVVEGDLAIRSDLLQGWCDDASALGNAPVDMLACVSPLMVEAGQPGQLCRPALSYERKGGRVWDGTSRDVREHFPTHRDQLRFVQYDSCRGLEGWTVINFQLDTLWDYKRGQWFSEDHGVDDLYRTAEETASQHASRWVMIPLTRAIDTLVINITAQPGFVANALRRVHEKRRDFVDWVVLA